MFDRIIHTESSRHGGLPVPDPPEPPEQCKVVQYKDRCNDCPYYDDCFWDMLDDIEQSEATRLREDGEEE